MYVRFSSSKRRKSHCVTILSVIFILLFSYSTLKKQNRRQPRETKGEWTYGNSNTINVSKRSSTDYIPCDLAWRSSKFSESYYEEPAYDNKYFRRPQFFAAHATAMPVYSDTLIKLDPDKFLLPVLVNGPNNQITGLREAAFVAIQLNRTLVIPKFFKHFTDNQANGFKYSFIYPGHRFEVNALCNFMSCITLEQFQAACGRRIDSMLYLRTYSDHDVHKFESYSGMKFGSDENPPYPTKLVPKHDIPNDQRFRTFSPDSIQKIFRTKDRCVLYPYPLYNLHVPLQSIKSASGIITEPIISVNNSHDGDLYLSLNYYSRIPDYISSMVKQFIETVMGGRPFLSIHWRYNRDDFMKRCGDDESRDSLKKSLCENALLIQPQDIAGAIREHIVKLRTITNKDIENIYIAAPSSEENIVNEVGQILQRRHGWASYSSRDLENFLNVRYDSCHVIERHFNDIISTTEMEICTKATGFLGSVRSSWTTNVFLAREFRSKFGRPYFDGDIFALSVESFHKRTIKS